jgi:hypothetical protein
MPVHTTQEQEPAAYVHRGVEHICVVPASKVPALKLAGHDAAFAVQEGSAGVTAHVLELQMATVVQWGLLPIRYSHGVAATPCMVGPGVHGAPCCGTVAGHQGARLPGAGVVVVVLPDGEQPASRPMRVKSRVAPCGELRCPMCPFPSSSRA